MAKRHTEHAPNEPPADEPVKKTKKRSPMLAAAAAATKHQQLTAQIDRMEQKISQWEEAHKARIARAEEAIGNWGDARTELVVSLDDEARKVFDRMVSDG